MFNFSMLFTNTTIGAAFDASIQADATSGRVNAAFITALDNAYGLALPASPRAAIKYINAFVGALSAPTISKGTGARTGARNVAQALHALGKALHEGGACKSLPTLAPLAPWADPEELAERARARAAARAAKPAIVAERAPDNLPTVQQARKALAVVKAGLEYGLFTASECAALATLVATCQRAPEKATKGALRGTTKGATV